MFKSKAEVKRDAEVLAEKLFEAGFSGHVQYNDYEVCRVVVRGGEFDETKAIVESVLGRVLINVPARYNDSDDHVFEYARTKVTSTVAI